MREHHHHHHVSQLYPEVNKIFFQFECIQIEDRDLSFSEDVNDVRTCIDCRLF